MTLIIKNCKEVEEGMWNEDECSENKSCEH